jgi:hypothetical protein
MDPLSIARNRVYDFEKEYEVKLSRLPEIEKEILQIGQARRRWLNSIAVVDSLDTEIFTRKLNIIKTKADLGVMKVLVDSARLQGYYEAHTLKYLVAATKPYDDEGDNKESREIQLKALANQNLDELRTVLRKSIAFRSATTNSVYNLIAQTDALKIEYEMNKSILVNDIAERINQYLTRLQESVDESKKNHKKITGDYLVLRHNAKVASDIVIRGQKEANIARKILQERLEQLVTEAQLQRERMEKTSAAELKLFTNDIRNEVIQKEREYEAISANIKDHVKKRKNACKDSKKQIKMYTDKLNALESKRKEEVMAITEQLKVLREKVNDMEVRLMVQRNENFFESQFM